MSYRPVSLLPIENKVLTKILENRLETYISDIIHPDQTGFIPGRHIYYNLRRFFNLMYQDHKVEAVVIALDAEKVEAVVIALDAEKAFDQIEWEYMVSVLEHFGFGKEFINWIRIIYAHPMASVVTNQEMLKSFHLFMGCRQGCPISPALFAIAMEPLATCIRACACYGFLQSKERRTKMQRGYFDTSLIKNITNKYKPRKPKQPYLVQTNTETRTITHETLKEYGCLNMVPNQRQR